MVLKLNVSSEEYQSMYELHTKTRETLENELQNAAYLVHQITTAVSKPARKDRMKLLADSLKSANRIFQTLKNIERGLD
jgi:hypothetical protein